MTTERAFDDKVTKSGSKPKPASADVQKSDAPAHARATIDGDSVARLQQTVGNAAVQRLLAQRGAEGPAVVDDDTEASIQAARGGGGLIDKGMAAQAGAVMGEDLSDVHVHTDSRADQLNRQLGAAAFTTGNDIFFRDGHYDPAGSDGRQLIAHELTHVVQQGAAPPSVQGKMTVNDPNDRYEAEADQVAAAVTQSETAMRQEEALEEEEVTPVQAQEMEEEEVPPVQAQEVEEEEEPPVAQMQETEELEEEA